MKYISIKYLLTFGFLILLIISGSATTIYDVFSNESIEVNGKYKEVISKQDFIKGEFDLDYFEIKGDKYLHTKSINSQIFTLCKDYVDNEEKLILIYKEIKNRVNNYHKVQNSQNNSKNKYDYDYDDYSDDKVSITLNELEAEAISFVSNILFFKVGFTFSIKDRLYNTVGFKYNVYYKVNLNNGTITKLENEFDENNSQRIHEILAPIINENYALIRSKMDVEDLELLYYEKDISSSLIKDVSKMVKFNEAKCYWMGWGLIVNFENYTESSLLYSGYSFSVFVPFEEARELTRLLPNFDFAQYLRTPNTPFANLNYSELLKDKTNYMPYRGLTSLMGTITSAESPKAVTIDRYQVFKDTVMNFRGKEYNEFDRNGKLKKKIIYNQDKSVNRTELFKYDSLGKILSRFEETSKKGKDAEVDVYSYDRNGNLKNFKFISNSDIVFKSYFYNGNYIYSWRQEWFDEGRADNIHQTYYNGTELCVSNRCYLYDTNGKLKGVNSGKYVTSQMQIGRDDQGRIIEVHSESDRHNSYYYYDNANRFAKYQLFEYQKLGSEGKYTFEGNSPFPKSFKSIRLSGGQNTVLVDDYKWEFYGR